MWRKWVISVLLLVSLSALQEVRAGNIRGTVRDGKTGETLVGAQLLIQGTTRGTITDFDGNFTLTDVAQGSYNLVVAFISYENQIIRVEVPEAGDVVLLIALLPVSIDVGEVKVVARKRNNTEVALMNTLKSGSLIVSGITAQQISKSQDKDAAEVVRRVPGITITDGRFVVVRGLEERYNSVMLNNATAPSFEADKRAFSFDAIPSGLIDNILIYKNPAPELPADFAGAAINIQTRNVADENSFSLSYGAKYNEGATFREDFLTHTGSKTDWLGWDDGSRALPAGVPSPQAFALLYDWPDAATYLDRTGKINTISALFPNNWEVSAKAPLPDQNFSLSFLRRFLIGKVSVGNMTSLNYGSSTSYTTNQRVEYQNYDENLGTMIRNFDFTDRQAKSEHKTGVIQNFNILYGRNQKLEFRNFLNQMGSLSTTQRDGINFYNVETLRMFDLKYESRLVYSGQLAGEQTFNKERTRINWLLGYGTTNKNQPDNRRLTQVQITDEASERYNQYYLRIQNVPNPYLSGRLWIDMDERIKDGKLDVTHLMNLPFSETPWQLKAGGFFEKKARSLHSRLVGVVAVRNVPDILFNPVKEIMDPENFWFDQTAPYTQHGLSYRDNSRAKDSYDATDILTAGYAALSIPLTPAINLYGGVRLENWNREITHFFEPREDADKTPIRRDTLDLFPSVNLTWNINTSNLVRLSYGKTVNRPEFREMAPFDYQDFELFAIVYGNPNLKSAYAANYDIRYEWYPQPGEMISVAGFYKKFTNPIETFLRESGTTYDYFPYNTEEAYSTGVEIDVRKRFEGMANTASFLRFMKDLTVVFNTSLIKSAINTSKQEFTRDTLRVMAGQSPYIVNLGLFYNNSEADWDINLSYNVVGKRIAYVGTTNNPHTWELPRNGLDLTFQKGIGERFSVKAGLKDILNEPVRFAQYHGVNEDIEAFTRNYKPNRQFSFSLIWNLE
ncbi:MAG TPA: TonB-dependent receptor [Prolixibacteraceae bacterium]|nr:TonB-dependent receptor [Prolixibacteraceae bacterium]HRV88278.1 TonB-dependent receptor [Prolixibacteraceae bacterium]